MVYHHTCDVALNLYCNKYWWLPVGNTHGIRNTCRIIYIASYLQKMDNASKVIQRMTAIQNLIHNCIAGGTLQFTRRYTLVF